MYHNPVMLDECIRGLNINPEGVYADVTFGGGGHSRAIMERLTTGHLYAFDQDEDAAANAFDDECFTFIPQNFKYFKNFIQLYHGGQIDGIIADLGVSSHQFDTPEKGFSTRFDGELDMRMSQTTPNDAATVVNTYDPADLTRILALYGEVQQAHLIAADIVRARDLEPIETTAQLKEAVQRRLPRGKENKVLDAVPRRAETWRKVGRVVVPLIRRPSCEELHENRQRRRQGRKGLLRQLADTLYINYAQADDADRRGNRRQQPCPQRETQNSRKEISHGQKREKTKERKKIEW